METLADRHAQPDVGDRAISRILGRKFGQVHSVNTVRLFVGEYFRGLNVCLWSQFDLVVQLFLTVRVDLANITKQEW